jgi:hypothetical protein
LAPSCRIRKVHAAVPIDSVSQPIDLFIFYVIRIGLQLEMIVSMKNKTSDSAVSQELEVIFSSMQKEITKAVDEYELHIAEAMADLRKDLGQLN